MYPMKDITIKPEKNSEALDGIWTRDLHATSVKL